MKTIACALMLAALPAVAAAAERPDWAFPPPGVTGAPRKPETGELMKVPGSSKTYTQSQIDSFNEPPDWFPDEHPPMPSIVAHGRGREVRACISCHLSTGHGMRPTAGGGRGYVWPGKSPQFRTQAIGKARRGRLIAPGPGRWSFF